MRKKIVYLAIVCMLVMSFFYTTTASRDNLQPNENVNMGCYLQPIPRSFHLKHISTSDSHIISKGNPSAQQSSFEENTQITTSTNNESHSCVGIDKMGNPFIVCDYDTESGYHEVYLCRSTEGGATWPSDQQYLIGGTSDSGAINPTISLSSDLTRAFVVCHQEDKDPDFPFYDLVDIDNPTSWIEYQAYFGDISEWASDLTTAVYANQKIIAAIIADCYFNEYEVNHTLHINWCYDIDAPNYWDDNESWDGLFWIIPEDVSYSHPTAAASNDTLYYAAQQNQPDRTRLVIGWAPADDPVFDNWKAQYVSIGYSNLTNPKLAASGDYAYVVAENDNAGNKDIVCYVPGPGGTMWFKHVVVDSPDDEEYPSITAFGNMALCTYVKNNNLYICRSTDGGVTWGTPVQVNDVAGAISAEYLCNDIEGPFITWTDQRNVNEDIYITQTDFPWTLISDLSGGIGFTADITNIGTETTPAMNYELKIIGGVLGLINKTKKGNLTIDPKSTGLIKSGLLLGLGDIDIQLSTTHSVLFTKGRQLLIFTLI